MSEEINTEHEAKIIPFPLERVVGAQAVDGATSDIQTEPTATDKRLAELLKEDLVLDFKNSHHPSNINPNILHKAEIERKRWQRD